MAFSSPYQWTAKVKLPEYNLKRVAAVWMDEYKHVHYDRYGRTGVSWQQNIGQYGDVSTRLKLRQSLQCESFEWYLHHHMPEYVQNRILGAGEIRYE